MHTVHRIIVSASALVLAAGCGAPPAEEATQSEELALHSQDFQLKLPLGYAAKDVTLASMGNDGYLKINDRVRVLSRLGTVPLVDPATLVHSGDGGGGIVLGAYSQTGHIVSTNDLFIRNLATMASRTLTPTGVIESQTSHNYENSTTRTQLLPASIETVRFENISDEYHGTLNIEPDAEEVLTPGRYGGVRVKSRARVVFQPGVYELDLLHFEPESVVYFENSGPIEIIVHDSFIFRARVESDYPEPTNIAFATNGAADIPVGAPFRGSIFAPNGTIVLPSLRQGEYHWGSFFGASVEVHQDATVVHQAYLPHDAGMPPHSIQTPSWYPSGWAFAKVQGVAHDASNWYFTQTSVVTRYPVTADLPNATPERQASAPLDAGHLGDPVFARGRLYIPLEDCSACGETEQGVAVLNPDLELVGWASLPWGGHAAWLAYDPTEGRFVTSKQFSTFDTLTSFDLTACSEGPDCPGGYRVVDVSEVSLRRAGTLTPVRYQAADSDHGLQGGAISKDGILYLSWDQKPHVSEGSWVDDRDRLFVVKASSGIVIQERRVNHDNFCVFNQELEGLTLWDLDGAGAPGISGQLHLAVQGCGTVQQGQTLRFAHFGVPALAGE